MNAEWFLVIDVYCFYKTYKIYVSEERTAQNRLFEGLLSGINRS